MADKLAVQKLVRGSDGRMKTGWVDEATGATLSYDQLLAGGYTVITASGEYYDPTPDTSSEAEKNEELNPVKHSGSNEGDNKANGGRESRQESAGYSYGKGSPTRFTGPDRGYINKPGWMGLTGMLPGFGGLIGKGVNAGININNHQATESARRAMGLPSTGVKGAIKDTLKDNKGQVARVSIGDGQYSIGFEALDKYGRTNMTPEEAMARAKANQVQISEIEDTKPTGAKRSLVEKVTGLDEGWAGKMLDSVFSGTKTVEQAAQEVDQGIDPTKSVGPTATKAQAVAQNAAAMEKSNALGNMAKNGEVSATPGRGLQDVADVTAAPGGGSISYSHPSRGAWDKGLTAETAAVARTMADKLGGNVNISSAYRSPAVNAAVKGAKNSEHMKGTAFDVSFAPGTPDSVKSAAVVAGIQAGAARVGTYKNGSLHFDMNPNFASNQVTAEMNNMGYEGPSAPGVYAMFDKTGLQNFANPNAAPGWFTSAIASMGTPETAPTPTTNPATYAPREAVEAALDGPLGLAPSANMLAASMERNLSALQNPAVAAPNAVTDPTARAAINAGIMAMDSMPSNPAGTISAEMAANAPAPGTVGTLSGARPEGPAAGMPAAPAAAPSYSGARPEGPAAGMPAARAPDVSGLGISRNSFDTAKAANTESFGPSLSPTAHSSVFDSIGPKDSYAKGVISNNVAQANNKFDGLATASPAKMATMGFTARTEQEKNAIAHTLAGELSGTSLRNLTSVDPVARMEARTEMANMVASIENRAAMNKYAGSVTAAMQPSQYNSLTQGALGVTNANYNQFGTALNAAVNDFYSGNMAPSNYNATSYYNADIANPSWGTQMAGIQSVGNHTFGSLPEYSPGTAYTNERDRMAAAQRQTDWGYSPSTSQLSNGGGGYTPGIGKGATSSPGNAVSGASRSTAGKTGYSGSGSSSGGGNYGGGSSSYGGGSAGKAASGGVSGASRSTAGKGGASPSAGSGGISGASRSTAGKTGGSGKSNPGTSGNMGSGGGTTSGHGAGIGSA